MLIFPSIWYENCPLVIHEAFLAGIPVIASRLGSIPEFIHDGKNGLLFNPGDSADLAEKLKTIITNPGLIERLANGIKRVKTISEDASDMEDLYIKVTD